VPKIAGYDIEKKLGAGGFGAVYLARHKANRTRVAIKVLLSKVAVREDAREKFLREIGLMKELRHDHIVALLDHGSVGSAFYFVMELCEGGSVGDLVAKSGGKLPLSQAGPIVMEALEGLAHAHRNGFIHRDLKPQNILLAGSAEARTAKIADLGLAKNFERAGFSGMTMTGHYCGTPYFMPREQVVHFKHVKPTSDVWSMGATFYNMMTGQTPLDFPHGRDPIEIILRGSVVPIRRRDRSIPKRVAAVIDRALLNSPDDRYRDAAEMREALGNAV
jgi:serine/threonine protein kinase